MGLDVSQHLVKLRLESHAQSFEMSFTLEDTSRRVLVLSIWPVQAVACVIWMCVHNSTIEFLVHFKNDLTYVNRTILVCIL